MHNLAAVGQVDERPAADDHVAVRWRRTANLVAGAVDYRDRPITVKNFAAAEVRHAGGIRADEIARNRIVVAPVAQVLADGEGSGRNSVDDETLHRGSAGAVEMEQTPEPKGSPADLDLEHRVVADGQRVGFRPRLGVAVDDDPLGDRRQGRSWTNRMHSGGEGLDLSVGQGAVEDGQIIDEPVQEKGVVLPGRA